MTDMRVIIFEGIATSGKSTVIKKLVESFNDSLNVLIKDEADTHIPIMHKQKWLNLQFFKNLVGDCIKKQVDIVIFDRLYLTQAYRSNNGLDSYREIEDSLMPYMPLTVLLKVDESSIAERVAKAVEHRSPDWGEYVRTKGKNTDEVANYYIAQQRGLIKLLEQSKLSYKILETTSHNYDEVVEYLKRWLTT
jgi:thymidylate kinase